MQLSRQFGWFHDSDRLIVVGCPSESQRDLDFGLGFGLAHARDRQLILVLPAGSEEPTRRRLPWLDSSVALYTYGRDRMPVPVSPLPRHEVRASLVDKVVSTTHQLGDRATWVARLTQWAEDCPELVPAHRQSYLAWHCRGRMIVKIRRARGRLVVTAGVHHSSQGLAPEPVAITSTLEPEAFHRLVATASVAIADRLEGVDTDNAEHQLQERLAAAPSKLGLLRTLREFPAIRPGGGRGYIDLLGVDKDGGIHVVETKIGPDTMLALQGLDYWVWTTSHLDEIVTHLTDDLRLVVNPKAPVKQDFLVADKAGAFVSPYTAAHSKRSTGRSRGRSTSSPTGTATTSRSHLWDGGARRPVPGPANRPTQTDSKSTTSRKKRGPRSRRAMDLRKMRPTVDGGPARPDRCDCDAKRRRMR